MTVRHHLSTRERQRILDDANSVCHLCETAILPGERWEVSHPIPLAAGGEDVPGNRAPAHYGCHREHTAKIDAPRIAKTKRQRAKHTGAWHKSRGFRGWRRFDGTTVYADRR